MPDDELHVLLVEDTPSHVRVFNDLLKDPQETGARCRVSIAENLKSALALLETDGIDAIVLDLTLPDSQGLDTLKATVARAPSIPVLVLTGMDDQALGIQCVREGAQDYLVKGKSAFELLGRSLRYAVERKQAQLELSREQAARIEAEATLRAARQADKARRLKQRQEFEALERLSGPAPAPQTAASFGVQPLSITAPQVFSALVHRYCSLLEMVVEQRAYKVHHPVADSVRGLAEELGFLSAGPRDVIELHTAALKEKIAGATPAKAQAYVDEARIVVLELMGCLVAYYRS